MSSHAYVKLVPGAAKDSVTVEEVKELLRKFIRISTKTGEQTGWKYEDAAFPYTIKETPEGKDKWFYLEANEEGNYDWYKLIMIGVDKEEIKDEEGNVREQYYVQFTLPETATYGDKGKATEYAKFVAKICKANSIYSTVESCILIKENNKKGACPTTETGTRFV